MTKPNWNDAPEWAEWLAQEENGDWFWHEEKPIVSILRIWREHNGRVCLASRGSKRNPEWHKTLEHRSEAQVPNEETQAECTPEERRFLDLVKHASMVKASEAGQTAKVFFCDWGEESNGNQFLSYLYRVRADT